MDQDKLLWIDELPAELAGQRALLNGLLDLSRTRDEIKWLIIGCSLARDAADRWSDLDIAMGLGPGAASADAHADAAADDDWDFSAALAAVRPRIEQLGELVDSYVHQLPGLATEHARLFVQYADRCQIDLVLVPAASGKGFAAGTRILYDPEDLVVAERTTPPPTPEQLREWAFHAWCALANVGKYLSRGSLWEALEQLHDARTHAWRLAAAADHVPDPQFGLTSYLDFAPERVPAELPGTVAELDGLRLLGAARRLAQLITRVSDGLPEDARQQQPSAMARYITADLAAVSPA